MATSLEDVLRCIENVRVKKNDGALYLMAERIAWMPNGKDSFTISHKYSDIKTQKISPEGKPKIQLQVVLNSGNESTTFHFVNPLGTEAQLQDRKFAKELLSQLLPRFKQKLSKEMEEKSRILSENPDLFQLYKELVSSHVISAEEFWTTFAAKKKEEISKLVKSQEIGISTSFLTNIKLIPDGVNGNKTYRLTPEVIEAIFRTYPIVKRKHYENVPHKLKESEFWERFFQSHYFHRERIYNGKDIFADCAKTDELYITRAINSGVKDPFVDLLSFDDNNLSSEGFGTRNDDILTKASTSSALSSNHELIRRFNQYSIMVLDASLNKSSHQQIPKLTVNGVATKKTKNAPTANGISPTEDEGSSPEQITEERDSVKRARLAEKIEFDDLDDKEAKTMKLPVLNIANKERYLGGPKPIEDCDTYSMAGTSRNIFDLSPNHLLQCIYQQDSVLRKWQPTHKSVLMTSVNATSALSELSPGGALMKPSHAVRDEVSADIQKELKSLIFALNELLRHFWLCFPVTSPQVEEKLTKMKLTLEEFHYKKLQPFHDKILRDHYRSDVSFEGNSKLFL